MTSARQLDVLYRESDKLYYEFARSCGISGCAYWILYEVQVSGGSATQRKIAETFSIPKQTVGSAIRTLEARGLVELVCPEGRGRSKLISLTPAGRAFCGEHIVPAIAAEDRAFARLAPTEQEELVRLVGAYTSAIHQELAALRERKSG